MLALHGTADEIMSRADSEAISQMVNQIHPGRARYLEIEGMGHGFTVNGRFYDPLIPTILDWMNNSASK